ncbi:DUF5590 domain-containing protein [Pseudalkalibacillus hwajinpoensis]|uniref:Cell wall elongation regulator TseB-like domain-containing protein n=1 Tax=Guptibacillus hwajinpoensis TaxID=208199 RepID=A0A4U1MFY6_9BACL|nr:DUF5590 domain-containing protein [Pseudalkalibacillus hwajinpoensis]TKD69813.1 hypothetical protein FBF83_11095 [Pseudalkalibacillus hwajinpoensis]
MKVIGIIAGVIFVLLIWQGVSFYHSVLDHPNQLEEKATQRAQSESLISTIDEAIHYHGTNEAYVVLKGPNKNGEEVFVFVPEKKAPLVTKKTNEGVTSDAIKNRISEQFSPREIIDIKPGIETNKEDQQVLVWEATFIDTDNRYTFAYYYFSNGEYWRSRTIRQS